MTEKNPSEGLDFFERIVFSDAPACDVFRSNSIKAATLFFEEMSAANSNGITDSEKFSIGIYQISIDKTFRKFDIVNLKTEMKIRIEGAAIAYLALVLAKSYAVKNNQALKQLKQIEKASEKLLRKVEAINIEDKALIFGAFTFDDIRENILKLHTGEANAETIQMMQNNMTMHRFVAIEKELQFLTTISSSFSNTYIGKVLQFGASGPKENSGLNVWVKEMAEIWNLVFEKSLTLPTDKTSGREQFLLFCEELIEPLHPDLYGTDAIRNVYEKLKSKGTLDYLIKKSNKLV